MSSALLNEIKIEIRSLLISSTKGLTEDELSRDYSLFNSQRLLPYQIFGYSTRTEFLNSLTDILYRSSDGYIHPIVDQSTEHIYKFVQQQKQQHKKKKRKTRRKIDQQINPPANGMKMIENSNNRFERINVTNELLKNLLIHFRQQQQQQFSL
jgi:hypothetical protein